MSDDILIGEIPKNAREALRVQLREFKGHEFVDLRLFVIGPDGELVPTQKGIGVHPRLLRRVIEALEAAEVETQRPLTAALCVGTGS
ncbi:hypothetical protein OPKNFCMD_5462 [Methylobacterium crusticola]|uniref:Transcriptional coactivator p15 (PC4) C-terminal domain-containing protein n=1 Tax=Methylobacterium crusticola TaxID=1697972 RepID=A0ABQ4R4T2_9HYPH|nr:transcriptional coactivator p15/PC4 family protein [Methylobacterium crusticola]GJD52696.1 hypothetical protein OPKNFCMD_5462 [Methylobacterium crusticola]